MLVAATAATSAPAAPAGAQRVPDAVADRPPARGHVEVLAAGHAVRLAVDPLALPRRDLLRRPR